ncbi:hypothetical protein CJP74_03485 [Psittacicella melopsittaci]|uniref:DUF805 domain-containing protein n=1 Tax=Psittacicella melopsittaci TaxID=2028576 RepID=A0A3A1Y363_9GAMM|nr:DUF805 domain-containing protein [Psittacicella melopsittaci]RIY32772.1 hypothetical protein CJP74_03485 [Psittacicella melopsittaci]
MATPQYEYPSFIQNIKDHYWRNLKKWGHAERRTEFWTFTLAALVLNVVIFAVLSWLLQTAHAADNRFFEVTFLIITVAYGLYFAVVYLGSLVRRLHDAGFSGMWILFSYVVIYGIYIVISMLESMLNKDLLSSQAVQTFVTLISVLIFAATFIMALFPTKREDNPYRKKPLYEPAPTTNHIARTADAATQAAQAATEAAEAAKQAAAAAQAATEAATLAAQAAAKAAKRALLNKKDEDKFTKKLNKYGINISDDSSSQENK